MNTRLTEQDLAKAKSTWPEDAIRELIETGNDNDPIDPDDLLMMFRSVYERDPEDEDEKMVMWSHVCAGLSGGHK